MLVAERILKFLADLKLDEKLPGAAEVLNPYQDAVAYSLCKQFYQKYYSDKKPRYLILGINPGRFGGGLTGIPFTDPIKLEKECGIKNELTKKAELSADFIYQVINAMEGPAKFYEQYYFSSISPLGFTRDGKNLNYYDVPALEKRIMPFIISSLQTQLQYPLRTDTCFCLGEGDNYKFLNKLNNDHHFFDKIIPLPHPRFIMQYKRKQLKDYLTRYVSALGNNRGPHQD